MFERLLAICDAAPLLQFPHDARPLVPLRRSDSGELVADDATSLHETALRCILVESADWHNTMVQSLQAMAAKSPSGAKLQQFVLGPMDCAPRPAFAPAAIRVTRPAATPD